MVGSDNRSPNFCSIRSATIFSVHNANPKLYCRGSFPTIIEFKIIICLSDNTVGRPEANFVNNAANPPSRYFFCQSNTGDRPTPRVSATSSGDLPLFIS